MKRRVFAGATLTLFLILALFSVVPVKPQFVGTIKIGAIGPMPWIQGKGMAEGAKLAAKQINNAGGVVVSSGAWKVEVISADTLRGLADPTLNGGTQAAMELVAAGVDFAIGGYRTEAAYGAREVFMDAAISYDKPIFFIDGATTNELVDCGDGTCGACVRCNYNRYKYVFRITPMNSTMRFQGIAAYLKYLMTAKLAPLYTGYASPLQIAVISEALTWADLMHTQFTSETFWNTIMNMTPYGGVSVVYSARVSPEATDVSAELLAAQAASAKLIIEVLSGPVGNVLPIQWRDLGINAFLAGINVERHPFFIYSFFIGWPEYETILAAPGTGTPITPITEAFRDAYVDEYGYEPIFTSYGAYDAMMLIKETIEAAGRWPMTADEMVPLIEQTDRVGLLGRSKFTGPHPMSPTSYNATWTNGTHGALDVNPTMMGTLHDVYMRPEDLGPVWGPPYYTRPFVVQWQRHPVTEEHRLEVVYPINMNYSRKTKIPPWIYSRADTDITGALGFPDGYVDVYDLDLATYCWLSSPGDSAWDTYGNYFGLVVDQDANGVINIADVAAFGKAWGYDARVEYGQWPLG